MCIFCDIIDRKIPSEIVYEDADVLAILDISQVTYGHTLVMPKKHTDNFLQADDKTVTACMLAAHKLAKQIVHKTKANGVNILTNCGKRQDRLFRICIFTSFLAMMKRMRLIFVSDNPVSQILKRF